MISTNNWTKIYLRNLLLKDTFTLNVNFLFKKKFDIKPIQNPKKLDISGFELTKSTNK